MNVQPNQKLSKKDFATFFLPYAKEAEAATGVPALAMLAQSALESGWNSASPGWMLFGIKDTDGVNGNEQLITTTEYSSRPNLKFPVILSITPVVLNGRKMFKYRVKDYFRKYKTPAESFTDHGFFLRNNKRYAAAFKTTDPYAFIAAIAAAGYATAPDYGDTLAKVAKGIEGYMPA